MSDEDVMLAQIGGALRFPILKKEDFVNGMTGLGSVAFRGTTYSAHSGAELVPAFFFPMVTPGDLAEKVHLLLASRGLEATTRWQPEPPSRDAPPDLTRADADAVIEYVAARVAVGPQGPLPDHAWVDAVDYVTHALEYADPPSAMDDWRATVADGEMNLSARTALRDLVQFVRTAAVEGRWEVASKICDCMEDLVDPSMAPQHVGGIR